MHARGVACLAPPRACFAARVHRVTVERTEDAAVVQGAGELDAYAASDLEGAFAEVLTEPRLVVDLAAVTFLDSTALGVAVRVMRQVAGSGGAAVLVLPRGPARRIFEITTLDKVLPVAESRADALARLAAPAADA